MAFSSDNYANSLISLNWNYKFSKPVRYLLRYGKCIGIRCKIELQVHILIHGNHTF